MRHLPAIGLVALLLCAGGFAGWVVDRLPPAHARMIMGAATGAASVPPSGPVPTISPGTTTVGAAQTCTPGTWTGTPTPTLTYQWNRDGASIATTQAYTIATADQGHSLTCVVTGTNTAGSSSQTSAALNIPPASPLGFNTATGNGGHNSACSTVSGTNNTIVTGNSGGDCLAFAVNGQSTGKFFLEVDLSGTVAANTAVGLGNTSSPSTLSNLGFAHDAIGNYNTGPVFNNNATPTSGATNGANFSTAPAALCVAVDLTSTTKQFWVANMTTQLGWNNTSGTAIPATGAGGIHLNNAGMTVLSAPAVLGIDAPSGTVWTINGNLPCIADTLYGWGSAAVAGFSQWPGTTATLPVETWNPNRTSNTANANTFSADHLTVFAGTTSAIQRASFGVPRFLSGNYYWEVTVNYSTAPELSGGLGVANGAAPALEGNHSGFDNNSIGYFADGSLLINNTAVTGSPIATYATGTKVCVAVNYSAGKVWFQPVGSGQWDNNGTDSPQTSTGGFSISTITQTGTVAISPVVTLYSTTDSAVGVFVIGASTPCSGVTGLGGYSTIP